VSSKTEQLVRIVGAEHVSDDAAVLDGYARDQSFATPLRPWFVVRPRGQEEVQALVRWANDTLTPLVPVSSGAPHFHGDTVPSRGEAVIVDLGRMNAIRRIDWRNKMIVIEPGVTYAQLEPELAREGLRISRPLLPRANKSVIASLLERQPTLIPRLNFLLPEPLRDCGVVWGSGAIAYTGEAGAKPLSLEAQWKSGSVQVNPHGPAGTDFMRLLTGAQGSMGIVVWASVKCELVPAAYKLFAVPATRLEDLVDLVYRLTRLRLGDELLVLNAAQLASVVAPRADAIDALQARLPAWTLVAGLGGAAYYPEERVAMQEGQLRALVQQAGLRLDGDLPCVTNAALQEVLQSLCTSRHWKLKRRGGCQDIFFLTTLDKTPLFVSTLHALAADCGYPSSDVGVYIQPQHQGVSHHVEFSLPFDPADRAQCARVAALLERGSTALIERGAYFSRPYGPWAQMVYSRDATATQMLRMVKDILDPKNILNPGKLCW
jgi:FAD/FMN-containing dehydrogenase